MKNTNRIKKTRDEIVFDLINTTLLGILSLCFLLPLINLFAKAVSSETAVMSGEVLFIPKGFQLESLYFMIKQNGYQTAFFNSVFVTVVGSVINIVITVCGAYPLSRKRMKGRRIFQFFIVFTMLFNGGVIPTFILIQKMNLLESLWSLILPTCVNPFLLVVMRNFFEGIPESIEESAKMDGASNFKTLLYIMLPLAVPCIATLVVFYAVAHWNEFFTPLMYIHKRENFTLQLYLQQLLGQSSGTGGSMLLNSGQMRLLKNKAPMIIQGAAVFLSIIPILVVYPFLQRYFVQGMTLGAVKG